MINSMFTRLPWCLLAQCSSSRPLPDPRTEHLSPGTAAVLGGGESPPLGCCHGWTFPYLCVRQKQAPAPSAGEFCSISYLAPSFYFQSDCSSCQLYQRSLLLRLYGQVLHMQVGIQDMGFFKWKINGECAPIAPVLYLWGMHSCTVRGLVVLLWKYWCVLGQPSVTHTLMIVPTCPQAQALS